MPAKNSQGDRHHGASAEPPAGWERPAFEVICLACEISAYAPDEGEPLF